MKTKQKPDDCFLPGNHKKDRGKFLLMSFLLFVVGCWTSRKGEPAWISLWAFVQFLMIIDWKWTRYCQDCGSLVKRLGWKKPLAFCHNCSKLIDPAQVLLGPSGTMDLQAYLNHPHAIGKFLSIVFLLAIKERASEVSFRTRKDFYQLAYRVYGVDFEFYPPPLHIHRGVCVMLKMLANLDWQLEGISQKGNIILKFEGQIIQIDLNIEPGDLGEEIFLRYPAVFPITPAEVMSALSSKRPDWIDGGS